MDQGIQDRAAGQDTQSRYDIEAGQDVQARQDRYVRRLQKLIQTETVSDPTCYSGKENFDRFHELMWEMFPAIREACELQDFDGSLLLKWKGRDESALPVLFMNHHDVVPADPDGWKHPPFSAEIADGKIWGRGTLDNKGGLWAMFQAAEELAASGFVPSRDIYFETACNEETLGQGSDRISAHLRDTGMRFEMVFDEGGDIVYEPIGGAKGNFAMIGIGEKSAVILRFVARSEGGHASTPGKNTPLVRLGKFMAYVESHQVFDVRLSPAVMEMLKSFAPYMGRTGKIIEKADRLRKPFEILLPLLGPAAKSLITTTIAFTQAKGGDAVNVIPREAWVLADMRCSHHQGMADSIKTIRKVARKFDLETEIVEASVEAGLTDHNGKAYKLVEEAVKTTVPGVDACAPYIMTGASDSRFFGRVSDQCIRFLPFSITTEQMDTIHGINECLDISTLVPAVEYYKYMMQHV